MEGDESRQLPLVQLALLALGLGVVTGIGAVLFRDLIGFVHNLFFTGQASFHYDANVFTAPAPWGILVILVPVLGAIGVTFLVTNFAPEAKGHGVPEVTAFDVIRRMWRRKAIMAVVVRGRGVPRAGDVAGVITKEHVADSVADSVKAYPQ